MKEQVVMDKIIDAATAYAERYMSNYDSSHDFKHILRVLSLARRIREEETKASSHASPVYNDNVITLACLLHDIGDRKYVRPGEDPFTMVHDFLLTAGADIELATTVQAIATHVSYSSEIKDPAKVAATIVKHPELAIVQDADRLDAIGAVGVGRCFTYNATKTPNDGMDKAIAHFGDKLEKLEAMMKTETGRRLARERTERLKIFKSWWAEENSCLTEESVE